MDVATDAPAALDDHGSGSRESTPVGAREEEAKRPRIQKIPVARIRPEDGLGRKRDRDGHRELRQSIEQFGVLTPVTVRLAPDGSGDYLLIKGQGRTLACRLLGIEKIPAIVVDDDFAENEKVQQFLVENVARLRMRPVDRALLIARARQDGEETAEVAKRFGVSPATVRRLEAQLDGASKQRGRRPASGQRQPGAARRHRQACRSRRSAPMSCRALCASTPCATKEMEALFAGFRLAAPGRARPGTSHASA